MSRPALRRALPALAAVLATCTAAALVLVVPLALTGSAANGAPPTVLSLTGYSDVLVDEAHGHVFVTQNSGTVLVIDLDGALVTTLSLPRSTQMGADDDLSTVYVASLTLPRSPPSTPRPSPPA